QTEAMLRKNAELEHTLQAFHRSGAVQGIVLAAPIGEVDAMRQNYVHALRLADRVVAGGAERQDSVGNALASLGPEVEVVVVHDAVRPFVTPEMIRDSIQAARLHGAALCAVPVSDTLKGVDAEGFVENTVDRRGLWRVQTPQAFRRQVLDDAFAQAAADNFYGTDESMLVERLGRQVKVLTGSEFNIKITRPEDLVLAARIAALDIGQKPDAASGREA
ncbi:MAG: 2-C-methyl-D-erythritol 4-phosphate cytidylyltransferase, partial [Nitrospinaceae bacterium]